MTVTHIFFDLHGTLVDGSRLRACYGRALAAVMAGRYGSGDAVWAEAYRRVLADWDSYFADLNFDGDDGLADLWEGEFRVTRALFRLAAVPEPDTAALTALARELPYLASRRCAVFYPDAVPVIERLCQAGYTLGIAAHATSALARGLLEAAGVLARFTGPLLCPDVTGRFRKDADFYRAAHLPPGACLVVDDSLDGVTGAKAAGMLAVHLCRDGVPPSSPADHLLTGGLRGLLSYLDVGES